MVDPTSDHVEDISEEDAPACSTCGASIVSDPDHRVVTWVEAGQARTRHFCDEACRDRWDEA